jgi:hypothetical protein
MITVFYLRDDGVWKFGSVLALRCRSQVTSRHANASTITHV